MSKYIKLADALNDLDNLWDYATVNGICSSTVLKQVKSDLLNLPTIEVSKKCVKPKSGKERTMTKQEAIEYGLRWKNAICDRGDTECSDAIQFLNMAIESLEQDREIPPNMEQVLIPKYCIVTPDDVVSVSKRGYWLEAREDTCWYMCSECKRIVDDDSNYCPNCGARMENGE